MLREKCQDYLPLIMIWQPRELWFETCIYLVWPLGVAKHTQESAECLCGSVLTIYCTNVAICSDQKNAVWMRLLFPVSELIWLSRRSPIGCFWLSKITFWVDYTLSTASPNYSSVLRWPANSQRNGAVTEGIKASKTCSCTASSRNPSTRSISSKTSLSHRRCLKDRAEHQKTSVTWFCLAKKLDFCSDSK